MPQRGGGAGVAARELAALDVLLTQTERRASDGEPELNSYVSDLVEGVIANQERIDELLTTYSLGWTLERMPGVDRSILRLGAYEAHLTGNSHVASIYGTSTISERHRHRYEVNGAYRPALEKEGLIFSGMSPDGLLPEVVERPDHPWFIGVQFHPELKSKPFDPHPLFAGFIAAALEQSRLV